MNAASRGVRKRAARTLLSGLAILLITLPPASAAVSSSAAATLTSSAAALGTGLFIKNGDLVTATGKSDSLIRFRPNKSGKNFTVAKQPLGVRLKPKGITHSRFCEKVAVANSRNVVVFDTWTHEITVIERQSFGLIADVEYDMQCNLIIADMGKSAVGRWPRDGHLWSYSPDGVITELGRVNHDWVSPAFLDMDEWGTLFVVDKAAGPPIPGTRKQWHYDAIYKLGPPNYQLAKARYKKPGLDVTAFMAHPNGSFYIASAWDFVVLDAHTNRVRKPCGPDAHFRRVSGIDITPGLDVFAIDGYDVFGRTRLISIDGGCAIKTLNNRVMLQGSQGLAAGLPAR